MFGSHLSIAGSMLNALVEARALGLDTVQVFTKNQQQWKAKPLDPSLVLDWRTEVGRLGWNHGCPGMERSRTGTETLTAGRIVAHASYLINLAGPDDALWRRSIDLMTDEIERCEALGIAWLVHHPGSSTTSSPDAGIERIASAYRELFARTRGARTVSCLENTVGSGNNLGREFTQLARIREAILDATGEPDRVAFCIDTCHAHAGGYDLSRRLGAEAALESLASSCGLELVRVIHMNDSKGAMGSRRDLHEHIGRGTIGARPEAGGESDATKGTVFELIVNHPAFRDIPKILETPKGLAEGGVPWDTLNLRRLRSLMGPANTPIIDEPTLAAQSTSPEARAEVVSRKKSGIAKQPKKPRSTSRRATSRRAAGRRGKSKDS